jgi:hypothetical protein
MPLLLAVLAFALNDTVHRHILGMADVLSKGIIRQFPRKFRS